MNYMNLYSIICVNGSMTVVEKKTYQKDLIFPKPRNLDGQRIEILLSLIAAERAARMTLRRASRMTKHN